MPADTTEDHLQSKPAVPFTEQVPFVRDDDREALADCRVVAQQQVELLAGHYEHVGVCEDPHLVEDMLAAAEQRGDPKADRRQSARQMTLDFSRESAGRHDVHRKRRLVMPALAGQRVHDRPLGDVGLPCRRRHRYGQVRRFAAEQAGVEHLALGRPHLDDRPVADGKGAQVSLPHRVPGGRPAQHPPRRRRHRVLDDVREVVEQRPGVDDQRVEHQPGATTEAHDGALSGR
jgi:hypothetical protein